MALSQNHNSSNLDQMFVELSSKLEVAHAQHGITMRPYVDSSLPHFSKIPTEYKQLVLASLKENVALFEEMNGEKESLMDSPRLLWRSLNRLGWTPKSDIFDKIEDGDVVEVYSVAMNQVFRNLSFFKYVSLSLEEIVSFPLGVMYEMEPQTLTFYQNVAARVASNDIRLTEKHPLEPYLVKEKLGEKLIVQITPKWISPVMTNQTSVGVIVIHRSEIL